ncbi:family 16 glycosylhydrolase [Carboxylicivirga sediminis]|uniref:Family 16 glycosylhydrolase n=1 Tax=Carboxylicivirga sediminis TaxID=2006564 RepID=A0A941IZU0_9BACT|nr:glycoside hydrolase family 16 protein [Carboxylicivirga sediminis]MBR8538125.1 family 16 glycosylhydrolase [Carboxylicivirga sediminis]
MKEMTLLTLSLLLLLLLGSCEKEVIKNETSQTDITNSQSSKIDPLTPMGMQPVIVEGPQASSILKSLPAGSWELDFSDEFEGSTVDPIKWNVIVSSKSRAPRPDLGIDDWWWTAENVWQENGDLVLRVTKEDYNTMHCGSVNSNNLYETQYGYFEARMKIADASKGTHTAFWFQGDNQGNVDGTANDGAEIDVFESAWMEDYTKSVIHIDGYGADHKANTIKYTTPNIHDGNYHTWGFHWTESFMDIYYDGVFKVRYSDPAWIVHSPEFLWLSDGASFGYAGDNFTREPVGTLTHAYVDYVRVWKQVSSPNVIEAECENQSCFSPTGDDIQTKSHASASNGQHLKLMADVVNDRIRFDNIYVSEAGNYAVNLSGLTWNSFGKYKCSISNNGSWHYFTSELDLYGTSTSVKELTFGTVYLEAGNHSITFTCSGKNNKSSGYVGSFDKITLTPQ